MSYLEVGGRRYPIEGGELVIGSDPAGDIVLSGGSVAARHALVRATPDGQVAVRRAGEETEVLVNGVRLGPHPTPLLHGDRIVIGQHELRFGDERQGGSTQFVPVDEGAFARGAAAAAGGDPAAARGGRIVSLTDGREYAVSQGILVIGRSTECDVVVATRNVSRRHAEIREGPKGYVVVDTSTNGTFVNGERVDGQRTLRRGDVIRCGDDEFRFYAEEGPPEIEVEPEVKVEGEDFLPDPSRARGEGQKGAASLGASPPPGAVHQLRDTLFGIPGVQGPDAPEPATPPSPPPRKEPPRSPPPSRAPEAPARPALATLLVRSGPLKGQRFPVRVPIVNIGRAEYNDVVIPDSSVSTVHAKLQRREGIWVLVDLESTNGTRVDGEAIVGEAPLAPGAQVQFGSVEVLFEPRDDSAKVEAGGATRLLEGLKLPDESPPAAEAASEAAPPRRPSVPSAHATPPDSRAAAPKAPPGSPAEPERPTTSAPAPAGDASEESSQIIARVMWGLLALVVLVVVLILFAG